MSCSVVTSSKHHQRRVIYLMDLDYRKGEIKLGDLNSEEAYDPDDAFCQSQLANMLTVTGLSEQWRGYNVTVNAVSLVMTFKSSCSCSSDIEIPRYIPEFAPPI